MVTLTKVKIKGFRGFTEEQGFDFSYPVTVLFGENGKGKSSLLNSIEWCLFGKECEGSNTGIRERIDWEVKNRNIDSCFVGLEIKRGDTFFTIKREYVGRRRYSNIYIQSGDYTLDGEEAEKKLRELINNYSFKDFLSSVYQHQEVVRFFVTQEPRDRNDAIDRLLGLYEHRNIIDVLSEIKDKIIRGEELQKTIDNLSGAIAEKIKVWKSQIEEKEADLKNKGFREEEISENSVKNFASSIKTDLSNFSVRINLNLSEEFNTANPYEIPKFAELAKKEIIRLRSEMPDVKKQNEIYERISELDKNLKEYRNIQNEHNDKKRFFEEFIQTYGTLENLEEQLKNKEIEIKDKESEKERINLLGTIIEKAVRYLKSDTVTNKNVCPLCKTEKEDLLKYLEEEYFKNYKDKLEEINQELETKRNEKLKIENLISEYKKRKDDKTKVEERFKQICESIRKKWNISEREDIERCLINFLKENESKSKEIKELIDMKQKELNKIELRVGDLLGIYEILKLKEQQKKAEEIVKSESWKRLQDKADEFKKLAGQINDIILAIQNASQSEARDKLDTVKGKVDEYFSKITRHPMIRLNLSVEVNNRTNRNSYKFSDLGGNDIIPILSQGNMNALALSIFLSLAKSGNAPFGFLMFDDPSQSLGSSEKKEFIKILNEIAEQKNLIISTMDREFFDLMREYLTMHKIIYRFDNWTADRGPQVIMEM
jgi:exonuclease SbcC